MARVKWCTTSGRHYYINAGLRQGGILSSFLFKVYIDGILNTINKLNVECKLGLTNFNIMAYADDMVLIYNLPSSDNIFEKFTDNLHSLYLNLNTNKTKCVIFGKKCIILKL